MRALLAQIALCSLAMSAVALALMLLEALALRRRRASARAMRTAWLVVIFGFAVPLRPDMGALLPAASPAIEALRGRLYSATMPYTPASAPAPLRAQTAAQSAALPRAQFDWDVALTALYIAGAALVLGIELWRHWRFRRTVLRWSRPAGAQLGALTDARVVVSRAVGSPLLMGAVHPVIALPESGLPEGELRAIIAHEECHRANRDVLWQHVLLLARALNWFNPLMPLFAAEFTLKCEQLCDEMTLSRCALNRRAYAGTILEAATIRRAPLTTGFSGGKYIMKRRLNALYSRAIPRIGALVLAAALMLTLLAPALVAIADGGSSQGDAQPTADVYGAQATDVTLSGGDTPADALSDLMAIALARPGASEFTAANLILAVGDGVNEALSALDTYALLEAAYRDEGLTFDEILDKYSGEQPSVANEALFKLMAGAPETDIAARCKLMLASGELFDAMYAQLKLGVHDARSVLCACMAYNLAAYEGRVADVCIVDAAERAQAMNALVEWGAAISAEEENLFLGIFGPMDGVRAEIEAQLNAESRSDIQLLPVEGAGD